MGGKSKMRHRWLGAICISKTLQGIERHSVDGSETLRSPVEMVVSPIFYRALYIPGGMSSINNSILLIRSKDPSLGLL